MRRARRWWETGGRESTFEIKSEKDASLRRPRRHVAFCHLSYTGLYARNIRSEHESGRFHPIDSHSLRKSRTLLKQKKNKGDWQGTRPSRANAKTKRRRHACGVATTRGHSCKPPVISRGFSATHARPPCPPPPALHAHRPCGRLRVSEQPVQGSVRGAQGTGQQGR